MYISPTDYDVLGASGTIGSIASLAKQYVENNPKILNSIDNLKNKIPLNLENVKPEVPLAAVMLTVDTIQHMKSWWKGEISGERCAKNVADSLVATAGAISGGMAGRTAARYWGLGWFGDLAGGLVGAFIGRKMANEISDRFTPNIFYSSKEMALDNAYKFLGLKHGASNEQINCKYECLKEYLESKEKYEPGKQDECKKQMHELELSMVIIKLSKGKL